jgi:hypothetical protein
LRALIEIVNLRSTNTNLKGLRNGSWEKLNWKRWKNRWSSESCNLPIKCNLDKTHELYLKDLIVCMYVRQFKTFTKRNVLQQQLHKYLGDLFYWFKWVNFVPQGLKIWSLWSSTSWVTKENTPTGMHPVKQLHN